MDVFIASRVAGNPENINVELHHVRAMYVQLVIFA